MASDVEVSACWGPAPSFVPWLVGRHGPHGLHVLRASKAWHVRAGLRIRGTFSCTTSET